jgi:DNA-binding NtrC family response regulator
MTRTGAFLVVDDDPDVLKAAGLALSPIAARVDTAQDLASMDKAVREGGYDAMLLDMNFAPGERSGAAGLGALDRARALDPALSVVLMTTYGGVSLAVQALKRGAADFVMKPWRNEDLTRAMTAATDLTRRQRDEAVLDLNALEKRAIARALALYDGNVSHAAAALGLTRPALYRRMERHGL